MNLLTTATSNLLSAAAENNYFPEDLLDLVKQEILTTENPKDLVRLANHLKAIANYLND